MGTQVTPGQPRDRQVPARWRSSGAIVRTAILSGLLVSMPAHADAAERFALVITGASGGPQYAEKYDAWRSAFVQALQGPLGLAEENVLVLAEEESSGTEKATRDNVRLAVADLVRRAGRDDVVLVTLIGHGSGVDADEAKFNLVGPDLTAREWADLLKPIQSRLVFINTASGSFAFVEALSARNRIVITANDTAAQQFETVFPEFIVTALRSEDADLDKNGRVSVWEAFNWISARVKSWYDQRGQLATERALLDDDGDGVGRLSEENGPDGLLAKVTYLAADERIDDSGDPERTALLRRRAELNVRIEELRARKPAMSPEEYENALEELLLELARTDRALRSKS